MSAQRRPPEPIPVRGTLRAAGRIVWREPRATLLPVAAIHIPVAVILAAVSVVAGLTVLKDEPLDPFAKGATRTLFLFLSSVGISILFSQVARAAAIRAIAGVVRRESLTLAEALDPAFTRMGGLIALALLLFAVAATVTLPFIGWILAPYLTLRLALAFEAFMLEDLTPFAALRRSWELTSGRLLRLLGVLAVAMVSALVPLALLSLMGLGVTGGHTRQTILGALYSIAQGVLIIPVVAFVTAVTTTFYLQATGTLDAQRDV